MQVPESEEAETMIVDGSFMVLSLKPGTSKDFDEYVDNVIVPFVNSKINKETQQS